MHIDSIVIKKFRHLENERIDSLYFSENTSDIVALAGPNGSGKSSVLELLGYSLSNAYSLGWSLSRTFNDFSFEVGMGLKQTERRVVIDSLRREIEAPTAALKASIQEIEMKDSIDENTKRAQTESLQQHHDRRFKHTYDAIAYLENNDTYYRAFNYDGGEYAKNSTLHNQLHQKVTIELKDLLKRSLGFFLRADRNYPQRGFDQKKIFSFEQTQRKEHLWSIAFNTSEMQYQDMYEFLVQQRYHYLRSLGHYHNRKNKGILPVDEKEPPDPLAPYQDLLKRLFPHYRFADTDESIPSNLFIELPTGDKIIFNDLSSGEKEVFFILSFFIRHNVNDAIIMIDEPELHLHPELSRLLVRNIKSIRNGNQIWIATHNSEIIDEAGRDRTIYVSRDLLSRKSRFIKGEEEDEGISQLKELFGLSGYIGIARNLVFLEGDSSSPDRKVFSLLFPQSSSDFKLIPSKTGNNLSRINAAVLAILQSNLGWMNYYLIRDRDYLTEEMIKKYNEHCSGRAFVLDRHEIENYLISIPTIKTVLAEIFAVHKSTDELWSIFRKVAISISSDVVRDMVSFRLNLTVAPRDFSIGRFLTDRPYVSQVSHSEFAINDEASKLLANRFEQVSWNIKEQLNALLSEKSIRAMVHDCEQEVARSLSNDEWLKLFPGKQMLHRFAKEVGIKDYICLQNSIIKELKAGDAARISELSEVFSKIVNAE